MHYFIAFGLLIGSSIGVYMLLRKKVLSVLSEVEARREFGVRDMTSPFIERFKRSQLFQRHAPEKVLHKILSRARILSLKTENKIAFWLEKLRTRAQEKNSVFQSEARKLPRDYWTRLKSKKK